MKNCRSCWLFTTAFGIILMTLPTSAQSGLEAVKGPTIQYSPLNPMNEKNEFILQKGQNFSITCEGKGSLNIKQQDIHEEVVGDFNIKIKDIPTGKVMNLYNVDHYAVGYYACFDDTVDSKKILDVMVEEPTDTEHVTFFYIYVNDNGTDPQLFAPMSEFATQINKSLAVLQCRPTMPDIDMQLTTPQTDETPEIIKVSPKIGFLVRPYRGSVQNIYECNGTRGSNTSSKFVRIRHDERAYPNDLGIFRESQYFMEGDTFVLNCTVKYEPTAAVALSWFVPRNNNQVTETNEKRVTIGQNLYNALVVSNATRWDEGSYTCVYNINSKSYNISERKIFLENAILELEDPPRSNKELGQRMNFVTLKVNIIKAYPKPTFTFFRDGQRLPAYKTSVENCYGNGAVKFREEITASGNIALHICNFTMDDVGNYTIVADNTYLRKNHTFVVRKKAISTAQIMYKDNTIYQDPNQKRTLQCIVTGYPIPAIEWIYTTDDAKAIKINGKDSQLSVYKVESTIDINPTESGNVTCKASNTVKNANDTKRVRVYEIQGGFGINHRQTWYPEGYNVLVPCIGTIYKYEEVFWRGPRGNDLENVIYNLSKLSHVATLNFSHISLNDAGMYTCVARQSNGSEEHGSIELKVEAIRRPQVIEPVMDMDEVVEKHQTVIFSCIADAVPSPTIEWSKDGNILENKTGEVNILYQLNHTVVNSTVVIGRMKIEDEGKYECIASSADVKSIRYFSLKVLQALPHKTAIISTVVSVMLLLIALVIYLMWKVKKEKQFRKELAAAGLLYFKEGVAKSLNPDLGIDEQAELLPYDEKFEFPAEKLILGKQLGAGAFGVVYKAEARGIINAEETTPVAVKMVKKTADNMYIKALASELKIMVHLGKHINIVNLLGACTKNVGKRELIVIVEYCKFGNIHNYMQKHREVFIDQLTDNKEKNLGRVNRGFSCSSGSSGVNSDYFGTHSQATDHTLLNSTNTNRSERKVSETGYVQPEWRSNYESDYSFDGRNPRPLTSRDLLAWAFQIARGMEYLASRKILHGDLAARNVLLAEDNVVKICDFGLAKSIYKNDEYQKKENSPLPVKWLAIECMMDRIFTTQSDVWAFGIVLWEMFSLAKTPYPNMSPQHLLQWLSEGHRLEKPPYADDRLHSVMMRCWEHKPNARPSFSHLQELLGSFLEDNVRNHYVDLNTAFSDMNGKNDGQDYLAMVSAPDYNNLVTASPHHYVNEIRSFFPPTPTQVPLDEEGYLQMTPVNPSIFSPRNQSTKFDFDAKKVENRVAESRCGSELTPMLTLNNLPARSGSESDHEGGQSPYLKMCPKITEETDDVFTLNENNEKNIQNSAVTNPTYISLDLDIDKKPQDINNYMNIPNGLVK